MGDGTGARASLQVDSNPFFSTTNCGGTGICSYEPMKSGELLQLMLSGSQITVQISLQNDGMAGPFRQSLSGFAAQYRKAVAAMPRGR